MVGQSLPTCKRLRWGVPAWADSTGVGVDAVSPRTQRGDLAQSLLAVTFDVTTLEFIEIQPLPVDAPRTRLAASREQRS
jgi:hypothetical protein